MTSPFIPAESHEQSSGNESEGTPEKEIAKAHKTIEESVLSFRDIVIKSIGEGEQLDKRGWRAYAYDAGKVSSEDVTNIGHDGPNLEPDLEIEFGPAREISGLAKNTLPGAVNVGQVVETGYFAKEPESCTVLVHSGGTIVQISLDLLPMGERNVEWTILHAKPAGKYDVIPLEPPEVKSSTQNGEVIVSNVRPQEALEAARLVSADLTFASEAIGKMKTPNSMHYRIFGNSNLEDSTQPPRFILAEKG